MKWTFKFLGLVGAALAVGAAVADDVPVVSNVRLVQEGKKVIVTYDLSVAPAVITMEVLTNGVPVAESVQGFFMGDVNRRVEAGTNKRISFVPRDCLPKDRRFPATTVRVKAWNVVAPPDYMTVQLEEPYAVRYFVSTNALPFGGLTNDVYRKSIVVLRRIHAAGVRWHMGQRKGEIEQQNGQPFHTVTLSSDYYLGIFEVTQRQQMLASGQGSAYEADRENADVLPCHAARRTLRPYATWWKLDNHEFSEDKWILTGFRTKTGVRFDLPTEAEWEYACRAGSDYPLNHCELVANPADGDYDRKRTSAILMRCAWYTDNSGGMTHPVGSKEPNAWGLYDMHGNLAEWPLDFYNGSIDPDEELDPAGRPTALLGDDDSDKPLFPMRGGYYGYEYYWYYIKNGTRPSFSSWKSDSCGYRLCAPVTAVASEN